MSDMHQDEASTQQQPVSVGNARPVPQRRVATESTPAKKKYGSNQIFASEVKKFDEARNELSKEMDKRWVGPMPIEVFFEKFLPRPDAPMHLPEDPFKDVPKGGIESTHYSKFIDAIQEWMPHLHAVNTSNKEDTVNNLKLKTDVSVYNRVNGMSPPEKTNFAEMELWIEFKSKTNGVAFQVPGRLEKSEEHRPTIEQKSFISDTADGINTRGQLASYAGAHHAMQFRHFSFSVLVEGDHARFLRWDPSGTVVTAPFDYRENPKFMVEFFWRFDHLSARRRGHDESVQPADLLPEDDARVREKLAIKDNSIPLYRFTIPGLEGYAYGPMPPTQNLSLVSRCTRSQPVVWIPATKADKGTESCIERKPSSEQVEPEEGPWCNECIIYLKDTWRFLSDLPGVDIEAEHEIYKILHEHKTPNIPKHVAGGDIANGMTRTQEFLDAKWLCARPRISPYQHYRLVHGVVGRALFKFDCTKQFVTAIFDALQAHAHAFKSANILHRDISAGNIILTDEGGGLLIDWEMGKNADKIGNRRHDRTGTWQFMSANLLRDPGKRHELADDLESFLHVLGWMTLSYVPAVDSYEAVDRRKDLEIFDEYNVRRGFDSGGLRKSQVLGSGMYPSLTFRPKENTPLLQLLRSLSKAFKPIYGDPFQDDEEINDDIFNDASQVTLRHEMAKKLLQCPLWFIEKIGKALDTKVWPADDKADPKLPIALLAGNTELQQKRQSTLRQNTHEIWERSKGFSTGSKRAASPTPESSSKRHHGTPDT